MLKTLLLFGILLFTCEARESATCVVVSIPEIVVVPQGRMISRFDFSPIAVANGTYTVSLFENQHRQDWGYGQLETAELFRYSLSVNESLPCFVNKKRTTALLSGSNRMGVGVLLVLMGVLFS